MVPICAGGILQGLIGVFTKDIRVSPCTDRAAIRYGVFTAQLHKLGRKVGELDTMIAAHALSAGLTAVARNQTLCGKIRALNLEHGQARTARQRSGLLR